MYLKLLKEAKANISKLASASYCDDTYSVAKSALLVGFIHSKNAPDDIHKHVNTALLLRILLLSLALILLLVGLKIRLLLRGSLRVLRRVVLLLRCVLLLLLIRHMRWLCLIASSWLLAGMLC